MSLGYFDLRYILLFHVVRHISRICWVSHDCFPQNLNHDIPHDTPPSILKTIESKVHNLRGAVRILTSEESEAKAGPETLAALLTKHPPPSRILKYASGAPEPGKPCLTVTTDKVLTAIGSFYNGSAAGLDGLRPGHLKELTSCSAGHQGQRLLASLTKLSNFLLCGRVVSEVCPFLFGASLCALNKKDGGIRPIVVGSTFRCLTAKIGCQAVKEELTGFLQPHQLGIGTRLGCEAAIHATWAFAMNPANNGCVIVKLDTKNAFNSQEGFYADGGKGKSPYIISLLLPSLPGPKQFIF